MAANEGEMMSLIAIGDIHGNVLEAQHPDAFIWGCDEFPDAYSGEDYIVYGHHRNAVLDAERWPHPNLKANRTCGIDTISHGVLTAIRFPDGHVFQSSRFSLGLDEFYKEIR
jgi:hypothetical protein